MADAAHPGAPLAARAKPRRECPRPAQPAPSHAPDPVHPHHPHTNSFSSSNALLKLGAWLMTMSPSVGAPLEALNDSSSLSKNTEQRSNRSWPTWATQLLVTRHSPLASRQPPAASRQARLGARARARVWRFRHFSLKGNSSFVPATPRSQFRLAPIRPQFHIPKARCLWHIWTYVLIATGLALALHRSNTSAHNMAAADFDAFDPNIPDLEGAEPPADEAAQQPVTGVGQGYYAIVMNSSPTKLKFKDVSDNKNYFEAGLKNKYDGLQAGNNLDMSDMTVRPHKLGWFVEFPLVLKEPFQNMGTIKFNGVNNISFACDFREWISVQPGGQIDRGMGMIFVRPIDGSPTEVGPFHLPPHASSGFSPLQHAVPLALFLVALLGNATHAATHLARAGGVQDGRRSDPHQVRPDRHRHHLHEGQDLALQDRRPVHLLHDSDGRPPRHQQAAAPEEARRLRVGRLQVLPELGRQRRRHVQDLQHLLPPPRRQVHLRLFARSRWPVPSPSRADRRQAGSAAWTAIMNMQQESPN